MSPYGTIPRPLHARLSSPLRPTIWYAPRESNSQAAPQFITVHHLDRSAAAAIPDLLPELYNEYADEIVRGTTYPQEALDSAEVTRDAFETNFFAADVFVGIAGTLGTDALLHPAETRDVQSTRVKHINIAIDTARAGRTWHDCIVGYYYIKPHYPGRSSHICSAAMIVPHAHRSKRSGGLLTRSYLHYAPALGYRGSIFHVYVNNHASIRTWENLGVTKVGIIPRAGRLRRADGSGEEYVDICVLYKDFCADGDTGSGLDVTDTRKKVIDEERNGVSGRDHKETRPRAGERSTAKAKL